MTLQRWTSCAMGCVIALTLSATADAKAQTDSTRRDTSQVRIPIRKGTSTAVRTDRGTVSSTGSITRRESGGDVALTVTRVDSLETMVRTYETRLDSLEAANASAATRTAA